MPWFQFQEKIVTFGDEWESPVHPLFPKVLGRTKKKVCIIFSRLLILRFPHKDTVCKQIPHYRKVLGSVRRIFSSSASYNLKACISHTHTQKKGGGGGAKPPHSEIGNDWKWNIKQYALTENSFRQLSSLLCSGWNRDQSPHVAGTHILMVF